jgi:tetratricopeptide (TPR) repeat protein
MQRRPVPSRFGQARNSFLGIQFSCRSHFALQIFWNGLNSSTAKPALVRNFSGMETAALLASLRSAGIIGLLLLALSPSPARATQLALPPETPGILEKIYSFDLDGAQEAAKQMQKEHPEHPLGYLLESDALWWRFWCTAAEFKYGMSDARRRSKLPADQHYLELAATASSLATAQIQKNDSAEMQLYAGMADAAAARLYALRGENRNTARSGVRAREHFLRAKTLDPSLADADFGLGLYNYYVDTLSALAKIMRFFVGIPGGSKQEGIRLLEQAIAGGVLTPSVARFYLAMNLHRYDQQYERALSIISPLVEKYPTNPLFQLARGDLNAKLGRKQQALVCYRAAAALSAHDAECQARIQQLSRTAIAALGLPQEPSSP